MIDVAEIDTTWVEHARCRGVGPAMFFPSRGVELDAAKAYCSACTVRLDCLEYALRTGESIGVWGGESERSRRRMRRALGLKAKPVELDDLLFGHREEEEPAA